MSKPATVEGSPGDYYCLHSFHSGKGKLRIIRILSFAELKSINSYPYIELIGVNFKSEFVQPALLQLTIPEDLDDMALIVIHLS